MIKKWPRQYALDILKAKGHDKKMAILDGVPLHFRPLVKCHVRNAVAIYRLRQPVDGHQCPSVSQMSKVRAMLNAK